MVEKKVFWIMLAAFCVVMLAASGCVVSPKEWESCMVACKCRCVNGAEFGPSALKMLEGK